MTKQNSSLIFRFLILGVCFSLLAGCRKDEKNSDPLAITMVQIPAGTFTMGSPVSEIGHYNETQHQVTLNAFKMSKYEITNAQFAAFLNAKSIGSNGYYAEGAYPSNILIEASVDNYDWGLHYTNNQWIPAAGFEDHPVIFVSWYGAVEFATYKGGRLPTEAEWEYACRANTTSPFNAGDCLSNAQANYDWAQPYSNCTNTNTTTHKTQAVGTYPANAFGLYDMHGNVSEFCSDWYDDYPGIAQSNPTGPAIGLGRVIRGGSFYSKAQDCRSAFRNHGQPYTADSDIGFRIVLIP